jgi:hypothetical protein
MAEALEFRISHKFAQDIATKLNAAAVIARAASELGSQGFPDRAFRSLLDVEGLMRDATTLLKAAAVVWHDTRAHCDDMVI